jgi:hypothetical protein
MNRAILMLAIVATFNLLMAWANRKNPVALRNYLAVAILLYSASLVITILEGLKPQ